MDDKIYIDELEDEAAVIDLLFDQLSDHGPIQNYALSGSGRGWFLDPKSAQMVMVSRGTEIFPVSDEVDSSNRMLVGTPYRLLLIPQDEIQEIGWN